MAYGLMFRSTAQSLGSSFLWFVPDWDMPSIPTQRGYIVEYNDIRTRAGNTFSYDKYRLKHWTLNFDEVSLRTKNHLEHICHGWLNQQQIGVVFFGTLVAGTTDTLSSHYTNGQCWGTGKVRMIGEPEEVEVDIWNVKIEVTEFGPDQTFS